MKTLLIYSCHRPALRRMCEAAQSPTLDILPLRPRYTKRLFDGLMQFYRALMGQGVRLAPVDVDFKQYDQILLADSLTGFAPSAPCNEFLYRSDLVGREVTCIVSNRIRWFGFAGSQLRHRIRLAGGYCRNITFLSERDLHKATSPAEVLERASQAATN